MMKVRQLIYILIALVLTGITLNLTPQAASAQQCDYYASPDGWGNGLSESSPFQISNFLSMPGSEIQGKTLCLLDGTYYGSLTLSKSGTASQPITIRALHDGQATIDGQGSPRSGANEYGVKLRNSSWINFDNLNFRNCWPAAFFADGASYISIRGAEMYGGNYVIYTQQEEKTHHILIENSLWQGDERQWTEWDWEAMHHMVSGKEYQNYSSGHSVYEGYNLGSLIFRNNHVKYAFNGINVYLYDILKRYANIEIYGNTFEFIRDNAIEPEQGAWNWHVYHNVFKNAGIELFSLDYGQGGHVYFYGNVAYWDHNHDITGEGYGGPDKPHSKYLFKWHNAGTDDYLTDPFYCYHNSIIYDSWTSSGRNQRHVLGYNNAYYWRKGWGTDSFEFGSSYDNYFDYDCYNIGLSIQGQEVHGVLTSDPMFVDDSSMESLDLRLSPGSPCIDKGRVIDGFTQSYEGSAPDIGAYEGDSLVEGPAFKISEPPGGLGYVEKPRITRHRVNGNQLFLYFSWDLDASSVSKNSIKLKNDGKDVNITQVAFPNSPSELVITTGESINKNSLEIQFNPLPIGTNGATATYWASTIDITDAGAPPRTCLQQSGFICTTQQVCPGTWLSASDSDRCCSTSCTTSIPEDLNEDGVVNAFDLQLCVNAALGVVPNPRADVNGDGVVNSLDIQRIVSKILQR